MQLGSPPPQMACDVRIGTSGWHYKHWLGPFYPADLPTSGMLGHYVRHFDTVEVNNTFYQLPPESSFDSWRRSTPSRFLFAVKASRFITHMKKLKEPEEGLARFNERIVRLGPKLGPVLFQLPPRWKKNLERLEAFLDALPEGRRYTFEFREPSWFAPDVIDLLRSRNAALCIHEIAGFHAPVELTADFTYVRLHGPEARAYQGTYSDEVLRSWAGRIAEWRPALRAIYVYFDNDQAGYAVRDALRLRELAGS
jgi:uncharacterized protein YecE (DUF72 family)